MYVTSLTRLTPRRDIKYKRISYNVEINRIAESDACAHSLSRRALKLDPDQAKSANKYERTCFNNVDVAGPTLYHQNPSFVDVSKERRSDIFVRKYSLAIVRPRQLGSTFKFAQIYLVKHEMSIPRQILVDGTNFLFFSLCIDSRHELSLYLSKEMKRTRVQA